MLSCSVLTSPHAIPIHTFIVPSLGSLPSTVAFIPALSRIPCKYDAGAFIAIGF